MMRIIVRLNGIERGALGELADRERRDPRDQAALMIRKELERLGYIQPPNMEEVNAKTDKQTA